MTGELDIHLHDKQGVCFESAATEILYGGAAGGGKSYLLRAVAALLSSQIPFLQTYLLRRISEDIIDNHFEGPQSFPDMLAPMELSGYCKTTYKPARISWLNESTIHTGHCQHEKDKYKYQGKEIHVLLMDELTHFTESQYRYIRGRCRKPKDKRITAAVEKLSRKLGIKIELPLIICGSNPGGVGHNWVKATFIDNVKPYSIRQMPEDEGEMRRQYIPALLSDNPSLDPDEYRGKLAGLGNPYLVKAMLEGSWDIVAGGMFDDLWNPAVHVVTPFAIPKSWYIDRTFDWGSSHPFSVCWWAESDGCDVELKDGTTRHTLKGDIYLFAELYGWNGKPDKGCRMLASDIARKIVAIESRFPLAVKPGAADNSIDTKENGNCQADDMAAQGISWLKSNKATGSRVQGWELMRKYFTGSIKREDPGMFIFDTCRQFIRTIPTLPRAESIPDDVDTKSEDHIADATRYRLLKKKSVTKMGRVVGLGG